MPFGIFMELSTLEHIDVDSFFADAPQAWISFDHAVRKAVISDRGTARKITEFLDRLQPGGHLRHFHPREKDLTLAWFFA